MTLVEFSWWDWNWIAQMFGKFGATTFSHSNTNSKWHSSSCFDETETGLPKWLEKLAPQHLVAVALIKNDTRQVVFVKLKLNWPNVY